ncbi:MAG: transcription-repair coupling factor [Desulfovibrionaceae bacterium]|nr:transcription-repair coupling factor [Desulfovibrionaceae bacterium]
MQEILSLIPTSKTPVYIQRSGLASMCRVASDVVQQGRSCLLVGVNSDAQAMLKAIYPLFSREAEGLVLDPTLPQWTHALQVFAPTIKHLDRDLQAQNIAALYALLQNKPHCVVTSLETLLLKHVPLNFFNGRTLTLTKDVDYAPELLIEQALAWGYERVSLVSHAGDIAWRGDILDIFPPGYIKPIRLEFFGDTLEEMRIFDCDTQRSNHRLEELTILPMGCLALSQTELNQAKEHLDALKARDALSENVAYILKKGLETQDPHLLSAVCFAKTTVLEDWLPKDTVFFIQEEQDMIAALKQEREELTVCLEAEDDSPLQPANLVLRAERDINPWNKFAHLIFANQIFADVRAGQALVERSINSFAALFKEKEAQDRPWQALVTALKQWCSTYRQVILSFSSNRGRSKFLKLAEQDGIVPKLAYDSRSQGLYALIAPFRKGCELVWENTLILGEEIIFPKARKQVGVPRGKFRGLHTFDGINEGDLLVHRDYGIGRFGGLHHLTFNNCANDFLLIEYAGHDKLYVPADNISLIQRYKGNDTGEPALDRLGGAGWKNSREKARKAIEKIAADLVEMYAYRKVAKGFQYGPLSELYHEFEATFAYEETPDQAQAIQDVLDDMAKPTPMDRLVCGDVGFGKTEVALRAAFRAASEGRQVALLCPTTVLAEQHYQTFKARLAGFPLYVGLLSRFVPRTKQQQVLNQAAKGKLDIVIGTHRLLSKDVQLPNLGLLILDEEQRFGVRHKEKLKELKKNVDVLTLTATPIPRTLQLSMSGIRDLSLIETAPENRKAVETVVIQREDQFLSQVIQREMERQGQIFWVHNRVQGLARCAEYVHKIAPKARIEIAHGQMAEAQLEKIIYQFWHGEIDILVCTSIVESGLDFPNVNTIIIDQAQMFGLGQLYQLRGRVGRSDRQAYAYLIVPDRLHLAKMSEERLKIIQEMDYLGAGFQLAMEDLRLRGAGNILGEVQSGHMSRVGLDLFLEMLENTVARLKGLPENNLSETELNLGLPAHIPVSYMDDSRERMRFYKALTSANSPQRREEIILEIRDRFGSLPTELLNFVAILNLKEVLTTLQVGRADINLDRVIVTWNKGQTAVRPEQIIALVHEIAGAKVTPPQSVTFPLEKEESFERALDLLRVRLAALLPKT